MSSSMALIHFQSALSYAGFTRSIIFGGPNPERQAVAFVLGDLSRVPADGYAVPCLKEGCAGIGPEKLLTLPHIEGFNLNQRLGTLSRGLVHLFRDADRRSLNSLALPLGNDPRVFGELENNIAGRLILAAAETFWTIFGATTLNYVLVAVQAERLTLEL